MSRRDRRYRSGSAFGDSPLELLGKHGYWTVLDGGPDESDAAVVAERVQALRGTTKELAVVKDSRRNHARLMTCKGTLRDSAGWISRALVDIGYDSAASHVAASTGIRVAYASFGVPNESYAARRTPVACDSQFDEVVSISAEGPDDGRAVLERIETVLEEASADDPWP